LNVKKVIASRQDGGFSSFVREFTVHSSQFTVHGSQFTVHSLQFTVRSSQFTDHSSQFTVMVGRQGFVF